MDTLRRARELKKEKKKLLEGHFFYFTANVPVDFMLMKNVLQTNGAEVSSIFCLFPCDTHFKISV